MELIVWMSLAPTVSVAFYDHRLIYLPTSTFSEHLAWLEWLETGRYRSRAVSLSKAAADHRHRRCRKRTKKFIKYLQQVWLLFLNRFATVCFPDSNQNVWPSLIEFFDYFWKFSKMIAGYSRNVLWIFTRWSVLLGTISTWWTVSQTQEAHVRLIEV